MTQKRPTKYPFGSEKTIKAISKIKVVKRSLKRPVLWSFDRQPVAKGAAIGIFFAAMTLLPFQMILAALFAVVLRANLPVAISMTWICNPLTIIPITYLNYYVGNWVLGEKSQSLAVEESTWKFYQYTESWASFAADFLQYGKAFFIGLVIVAISASLLSYFIVYILWRKKS